MRFFLLRLIPLLLVLAQTATAAPALVPAPPQLAARAWLLTDYHSGVTLAEHNSHARIEPASLTKMMTAYVVLYEMANGSIKPEEKVRISEKAWRMKGSRMFVEVNSRVSVDELLKGMIIQSGNDASVALAEHVAGSEDAFVELMNQHARSLGMNETRFSNSTGWPNPEHYTTVHDLAILARALIRDFPEHYGWYKVKEYTYNNIRQFNRNRLLWLDERVDGIKTGHTESAGYCLVASAKQNDMRLISVVVGTGSEKARANASRKLLNYGFRFYETFLLHKAGEPLKEMRIWKGASETVPLGLEEDLYLTIPRGQRRKIKASMTIDSMLIAPARQGQQYGTVNIMLGEEELASRPLVALQDVPEGGLWRKLVDSIKLMFR
jgi:D-alanyl-D-alanine carboxypeptidase (penicillin-binding protein 5/6)